MARAPRQPGLFEAEALPPPKAQPLGALAPPAPAARTAGRHLWLGLYFPGLPLEALPRQAEAPLAVLGHSGRQARVQFCNSAASRHGVRPGLPVNAALALLPELELQQREPPREQQLLCRLAELAMQFTPGVSLAGPAMLLMEIGGSLKLFGDAGELRMQLVQAMREQGCDALTAIAPTARAANWLAFAETDAVITQHARLAGQLGQLRITRLPWPAARCKSLGEMGVESLADCVRLPRDGLARRFGTGLLQELDQAYGRRPQALDWFRPQQHFDDRLELEQESRNGQELAVALDILVERLASQLRACQRSVHRVWLCCEHRDQPDTRLRIGLLQATAEPARLQELGRVKLAATVLPAAVTAVRLQAALDGALALRSGNLLEGGETATEDPLAFVERLRARLGAESVHGLQTCAEHRPERAWQAVREPTAVANSPASARPAGQRPLWMLPVPLKLREVRGQPIFQGALQLALGPERIETGWWDGGDIRRDYYVASNDHGMRLWVYRDLRQACWYLHGLFG